MLPNMIYRPIDACCRLSNHSLPRLSFFSTGRGRATTFLAQASNRDPIPSKPKTVINPWGLHTARPFTSLRKMQSDVSDTSTHDTEEEQSWQPKWTSTTLRAKSTTAVKTFVQISAIGNPIAKIVKTTKNVTTIRIRPSYSEKPAAVQNLVNGLQELLLNSHSTLISGFGSAFWYIDETGLAIHRHFVLRLDTELENVLKQIQAAANEMNHHPHIAAADGQMLTITCSTHVPPGLSMRDVKLARKIDELMEGKIQSSSAQNFLHKTELEEILRNRKFAEEKNMSEIHKAHQRGSCGTEASSQAKQSADPTVAPS